ncbi:Uncharacterised protein [Streptococcus pneumoniae]|nr:Uncharacterised protein [Streptococcus pneumoniae]
MLIQKALMVCELGLIDRIHDFQHHLQEQLFLQVYGSITAYHNRFPKLEFRVRRFLGQYQMNHLHIQNLDHLIE